MATYTGAKKFRRRLIPSSGFGYSFHDQNQGIITCDLVTYSVKRFGGNLEKT